ncbi:hypothetical protein METBIDRAFT_212641 [Metschnikowia bicuspidata var. bicuspidata NRRL YB-4993]|uniref:Nitrogen regulatory protein areA GATA-like domain-containing protein n=1 Tax=Metschnikowia bicuspidata var. bicuspidata NRRL YB-4993 TaxID=869754 RepID=A0A1A0H877_9ASCO|nr:hypothetical protein METBIDRAFT_212641 [Metschnikowia bicuspidata var. bicuspidata NRRL YB-4993]OBA20098.1 hypothetical protein METBIDRAFT_212641 [Metschnikowia bicuspidata var. bicuspidata NRRL YB-4993]
MASNSGEIFCGGATTSQHVDADDDDHFQNTTFKLKRTRSLGLLDEFIDSEQQQNNIEKQNAERENEKSENHPTSNNSSSNDEVVSSQANPVDDSSSPVLTAHPAFLTSPDILPHDDSDLVVEPSRHVDYLSHKWDVSDISKSWRYVILRRKNVANAARLENASWRTWAQRRSNLKTISPEEVNWSKESDVTWLYGPIVDDDDHDHDHTPAPEDSRSFSTASSVVAGDISIARKTHGPKPILKRRTMEDIMISHLNLLKLEIATARAEQEQTRREDAAAQARRDASEKSGSEKPPEYFDYDVISAKLNSQYKTASGSDSTNNSSLDLSEGQKSSPTESKAVSKPPNISDQLHSGGTSVITHSSLLQKDSSRLPVKEKRHIHFNDEVQQCIAIDDPHLGDNDYDDYDDDTNDYDYEEEENYSYDGYNSEGIDHADDYHEDDDDDDDDDDDEGGFFLNVRSPSSAQLAGRLPGLSSQLSDKLASNYADECSETPSTTNSKSIKTIHLLPPTTLNYGSYDEDSDDSNPYTSSISHNVDSNSSRGYDYYYDYNTVYQVDANHAVYGDNSKSKVPDVVDVPENITVGSNFDYEIIENEDLGGITTSNPEFIANIIQLPILVDEDHKERLPISCLDDSATKSKVQRNLSLESLSSEDSSDSDDEGCISISAKNSSQSLAQLVFGLPLTSNNLEELHYPQRVIEDPEPDAKHITSINPNYSSSALSKQPHSSNSLSGQFFGDTMTNVDDTSSLCRSFFNLNAENSAPRTPHTQTSFSGNQSPPVQAKATALPPHTTSACVFLGSKKDARSVKKSFIFDSESDTDEDLENVETPAAADNGLSRTSYLSLYEVAGKNGITVPSPEGDDSQKGKKSLTMTNFLGSWNKGNLG